MPNKRFARPILSVVVTIFSSKILKRLANQAVLIGKVSAQNIVVEDAAHVARVQPCQRIAVPVSNQQG